MIELSLFVMVGLTVLIAIGLRWREERAAATQRAVPARPGGWLALQKHKANRWVTAAALAALATMLLFGGINWLRIWNG
jgi:hypothetical protein